MKNNSPKVILKDDAKKGKKQGAKTGFANLVGKDFDTLNQSQKEKMLKAVLELLGLTENGVIL